MAEEFIYIAHPDVSALGGPVSRQAFREVWEPRNWTEATPDAVRAHEHGIEAAAAGVAATDESPSPAPAPDQSQSARGRQTPGPVTGEPDNG